MPQAKQPYQSALLKRRKQRHLYPYAVHSFLDLRYGPTHYRIEGNFADPLVSARAREQVVFLHGFNGSLSIFDPFLALLKAKQYLVLTYDLYGHGLSVAPRVDPLKKFRYTVAFFVEQLEELLEQLALHERKVTLVGFSLGCIVAVAFMALHNRAGNKLVLLSPAGIPGKVPLPARLLRKFSCCIPPIPFLFREHLYNLLLRQRQKQLVAERAARHAASRSADELATQFDPQFGQQFGRRREPPAAARRATRARLSGELTGEHSGEHSGRARSKADAPRRSSQSVPPEKSEGSPQRIARRPAHAPKRLASQIAETNEAALQRRLRFSLFWKRNGMASILACAARMPLWEAQPLYEQLDKTKIPTFIIWAELDEIMPYAPKTFDGIENKRITLVRNAGHLFLAEKSRQTAKLIQSFLAQPDGAYLPTSDLPQQIA